jgi:hypothetical protein
MTALQLVGAKEIVVKEEGDPVRRSPLCPRKQVNLSPDAVARLSSVKQLHHELSRLITPHCSSSCNSVIFDGHVANREHG